MTWYIYSSEEYMVQIYKMFPTITKLSLKEHELIFEVFKLLFFYDILTGAWHIYQTIYLKYQWRLFQIFNLRHNAKAICKRTSIKVIILIGKNINTSISGKRNQTTWLTSLGAENTNHHCWGRSSRNKYCEDSSWQPWERIQNWSVEARSRISYL
jgi:hypothetical protein